MMLNLTEKHFDDLKKYGFLEVDKYITQEECTKIIEDVEKINAIGKLITVDSSKAGESFFQTVNGNSLIDASDICLSIRDATLSQLNSGFDKSLKNILNTKIGISINRTPEEGMFVKHFDRNKITAVIYLSSCIGGEMVSFPRIRLLLPWRYKRGFKMVQLILDKIIHTSLYQRCLSKPIITIPKPGKVIFFEGARTLHGVQMVEQGSTPRYSLQLAYDDNQNSFGDKDTKDYYGK
jgi:hypothetical protein